jgi:hypothetical protein
MKTLFIFLIFVSVSRITSAQSADEKEVAKAVELFRQALVDGKENPLKEIVAEELSYGHSNGRVEDKTGFIKRLVSGESDFKTIELSEQTISVTDNTAIVRHKLVAETSDSGQPGNVKLAVLLIWQKQKGKWKLLARQATKLT